MRCQSCSKQMKLQKGLYRYKESGLTNVYLKNIRWYRCPRCRAAEAVIPRIAQLHRCIAWRIATKPALLSGQEIVYLRKMLKASQGDFAKVLNVNQVTVSRWEHGRKQSSESDLLIRVVYIACKRDEYTEEAHEKLWDLLRGALSKGKEKGSTPRITIDPTECTPDKEIKETLALCTAIAHQQGKLAAVRD